MASSSRANIQDSPAFDSSVKVYSLLVGTEVILFTFKEQRFPHRRSFAECDPALHYDKM